MGSLFLIFHISCGILALSAGTVALATRKGETIHRTSGKVFVLSMAVMALTGAVLAHFLPERVTVLAGMLTFYLVLTSWMAASRKDNETGRFEILGLLLGLLTTVYGGSLVVEVLASTNGTLDGNDLPLPAYFVFSGVALLATILDLSVILRKGIEGRQRIARHLWRMCFAFLIAAASFFLGQDQVFPVAVRESGLLALPVLSVLIVLFVWLGIVMFTSWADQEND